MKKITIYLAWAFLFLTMNQVYAQVINWNKQGRDYRHIINLNAGAEYGLTFGAGYGYKLHTGIPVILGAEYSFPSGKNLTDDFKTKIGGTVMFWQASDFMFSARIQGVFRRYENSFASLLNFGSDMAVMAGYYKPRWFVATETGFDKAIVTHFKHTAAYRKIYPEVKDGWYEPATGGNFYFGMQGGWRFGTGDIYLKGGKLVSQDFSTSPLLPYYFQVGYNIRIK